MVDDKATGISSAGQRTYLVERQRMHYEGMFVIRDLYKTIDEYYEEKDYNKREILNAEIVKDNGERFIEIIFEPWRKISDYAKSVIKTRMLLENVKEVEIEKDGLKRVVNQGKIQFVFDVYAETDYPEWENDGMGMWGKSSPHTFIRILFDRYFFKNYTKYIYAECMNDHKLLLFHIRTYLNMNKV
jgi:hypothetical protein